MKCPNCQAEAKLDGDRLSCKDCGELVRDGKGQWTPAEPKPKPAEPATVDPPKPVEAGPPPTPAPAPTRRGISIEFFDGDED